MIRAESKKLKVTLTCLLNVWPHQRILGVRQRLCVCTCVYMHVHVCACAHTRSWRCIAIWERVNTIKKLIHHESIKCAESNHICQVGKAAIKH